MHAEINGIKMTYDDLGQGSPIMLIHGFPLCRKMWQPQAEALVAAGYQVILPDLRGFGESTTGTEAGTIGLLADDLIALLDHLEIEQAVVGGMSMGGYVLLNLLARYPQRVTAACFIVTRADADDDAARGKRNYLISEIEKGNSAAVPEAFVQVLFGSAAREQQPDIVTQVRSWMDATSPTGLLLGLHAIRDRAASTSLLTQWQIPALIIGAGEDRAIPVQRSLDLAAGISGARLCVIENAGHMANLEQPEKFNALLLDFLNQLKHPDMSENC